MSRASNPLPFFYAPLVVATRVGTSTGAVVRDPVRISGLYPTVFNGATSFASVDGVQQPPATVINDGFAVSLWMKQTAGNNGYLMLKTDGTNRFYGIFSQTSTSTQRIFFHYRSTATAPTTAYDSVECTLSTSVADGSWHQLIVNVVVDTKTTSSVEFYVDGERARENLHGNFFNNIF